ncbi:MAG: HAD family hydrolase [Planctomycetaceae bacterium]|nr:HAD family hydrolase [Planctomycetaceae bacterium]
MARFSTIIFDLDGTLLDTLADIAGAANQVLEQVGAPAAPVDHYRYYVGDGVINLFSRALPEELRTEDNVQSCVNSFGKAYSQHWNIHTKPYKGIPELLASLLSARLRTAVLSNKPHEFTKQCIAGFLPEHPFHLVLGQSDLIPPKPDPTGLLNVVQTLKVSPENCLYVGDTATDMQTAVAVGMFAVGVTWGFRPRQELVESGAQALIDCPDELLELISPTG